MNGRRSLEYRKYVILNVQNIQNILCVPKLMSIHFHIMYLFHIVGRITVFISLVTVDTSVDLNYEGRQST